MEAINYARQHFYKFVHRHEKDIQALMGMFLFIPNGIASSPYTELLSSELWIEIYDTFTRDACMLLGLSVDSPLSICVNAGCVALPSLLNIKQVMCQRQVSGIWNGKDELPVSYNYLIKNMVFNKNICSRLKLIWGKKVDIIRCSLVLF